MKITKRDIEIIKFINEVGFCLTPHLCQRFSIKYWRLYKIMRRLIVAGLVVHKRTFHGQPGVYFLTKEGAGFTDLPVVDKVSYAIYEHQVMLTSVILKLVKKYPDANWISERQLIHEKFYDGIGKRGHISDGIFQFPDGKQVAIEVELSSKGKHRIERILKFYAAQLAIKEVWYFCAKGVIPVITALADKKPFVKVHSVDEFLHE